jgi:hypothetical protein
MPCRLWRHLLFRTFLRDGGPVRYILGAEHGADSVVIVLDGNIAERWAMLLVSRSMSAALLIVVWR